RSFLIVLLSVSSLSVFLIQEKTSFLWKVRIFLFNISCCAAAAYFFRRHNKYCETGGDGGHAAGGQKILILDQLEGQQGRGQRLILFYYYKVLV
ncbi:hypothetical protein XENOCAPTIV_021633, partial [Xenoophorus captivus]